MDSQNTDRLKLYSTIKKQLQPYSNDTIESGIMLHCLFAYGSNTSRFENNLTKAVADIFRNNQLPTDIGTAVEFFETMLEDTSKNMHGIVFTPQYIANYIVRNAISESRTSVASIKIIDPGCGCGIFLVAAAEYLHTTFQISIDSIIENNIYGIDINPDNVRRCLLILRLLSAKYAGNFETITPNIFCGDSLKLNWSKQFRIHSFNYIIGNPPYINPHSMDKQTAHFLKESFITTRTGVCNIFYAFIEKGMEHLTDIGILSFILPNNFLTIKSALDLRKYLQTKKCIKSILDFGENMVFKPVRTYNCIVQFTNQPQNVLEYHVLPKSRNLESAIKTVHYSKMPIKNLEKTGWKLVDEKTSRNLQKIETQFISIKEFIHTGIATLRDNVYLVEHDEAGYYKIIDGVKHYIESDLIKPIYKIPDLKLYSNIDDAKRYIIFPYKKSPAGYTLIPESEFASVYPKTYYALSEQRNELDARDKGKGASKGWYAYGRTQGLNNHGPKLLFPTFSGRPNFVYVDDEDALFCNGYAICENDTYDLDILQKILNSYLMEYYVSNTSYSIEGGYYCYQKKYVERFSLPYLTDNDLLFLRNSSKEAIDEFLWSLFDLE